MFYCLVITANVYSFVTIKNVRLAWTHSTPWNLFLEEGRGRRREKKGVEWGGKGDEGDEGDEGDKGAKGAKGTTS